MEVLPTGRCGPFDPPPELARFREEQPLRRLMFADGHVGWLVTNHELAKAVLADSRFSSRAELQHPEIIHPQLREPKAPVSSAPGVFIRMDPPEHTRYRRLLTRHFTVRRMNGLQPRIEALVGERLSSMAQAGPPVDLVDAFARPIPSLVISELLGVPESYNTAFQRFLALEFNGERRSDEEILTFRNEFETFFDQLIRYMRTGRANDLLSDLINEGGVTNDELKGIMQLLLIAGHETTSHMLALGTFALLSNPDQLAALRDGRVLVSDATEELLRYLTIFHFGRTRTALKGVTLEGRTIKAGECVSISLPAANRDPAQFDGQPEELDLSRRANGHLAFGHGIHQCLGQQLARVQMRVGFAGLIRRFPTLHLAVPADEVVLREHFPIYGVYQLPVAW